MDEQPEAEAADTGEAGMTPVPAGESGLAAETTYAVEVPHSRKPVVVEDVNAIEVLRGGELVMQDEYGGWIAVFANGEWRSAIAQETEEDDDA